MQRSGGGAVSREINVNSRRPLIPVVRRYETNDAQHDLGQGKITIVTSDLTSVINQTCAQLTENSIKSLGLLA